MSLTKCKSASNKRQVQTSALSLDGTLSGKFSLYKSPIFKWKTNVISGNDAAVVEPTVPDTIRAFFQQYQIQSSNVEVSVTPQEPATGNDSGPPGTFASS